MKTVTIIDYGMSNLHSVSKAFEHVAEQQWQVVVSRDADAILQADKVVFPGQGAMGNCMQLLRETQLIDVIRTAIAEKPFFGICLGLQTLLTYSSENNGTAGFDIISGENEHFPTPLQDAAGEKLKIPHMGWNQAVPTQSHPLWAQIPPDSRFYFVHSYYVVPTEAAHCAATTEYGITFTAAVAKDNLFAVQFHPEKSQRAGLQLLRNFLRW